MCIRNEILAAQAIQCVTEIVVAGGMENMSLIPHYMNLRNGTKFGPATD
jgi:acetyl-CoA C-acetyltransferase